MIVSPGSPTLARRTKKNRGKRDRPRAAEPQRAATSRRSLDPVPHVAFVALLVFASGCSALVFQVAWMRELRLIFGATTAAVAAVLAIFMAGLGVGSAVLGKRADRVANPLRMYGLLEAAIALSAAVTPWLVALVSSVYIGLGGQESLGLTVATSLRLALAAAVMAVPVFLMGGTLPAAVRAVTRIGDTHRRALGVLYGSNTLGAVCGTAAATFFALEQLGTRATLWTGCAIGLVAGAIAVARSRGLTIENLGREPSEEIAPQPSVCHPDSPAPSPQPPHLIYLTAAVLGFTFFALELVWYRMLAPILGGTAFTFGLILCIALLGIGVGGLAYNVLFRRLSPSWSALAVTCGCEAALTVIPFALGDRLALLAARQAESATGFGELIVGWSYVAGIVVLPVALIAGLQFPLLTALLGTGRQAVSRHLGMTYAWNTLGAIAGSLVAGFGAMPLLSAPGMWQAIGVVLAILSAAILVAAPRTDRRTVVAVAGLALVTVGSTFAQGPTAVWRHSGIGAGRANLPAAGASANLLRQWVNEKRHVTVWDTDGLECSVGIQGQDGLAFVVNGKSDGNALGDAPTQIGVAILGAVLHPDPRTGLVIGLGTGESAGWLAQMRDVGHVDVVELEPAIDEMARRCSDLNWDVLNHPRVRRIYNDGREFVFATDSRYDVIISEPSNPYRAGIAALYTTEFYQAARRRLNPGGVFVQFLQAYEVDNRTIDTVLATVRSAFPHVEVWQTLGADLQVVASDRPLRYSAAELRERIAAPGVKEALAKAWKMEDVEGFLGHFVGNSGWADRIARLADVPLNTDDRTVLEYSFARTVGRETPFSVEATRDFLRVEGFHRPLLEGEPVDWNLVELRRQEMNLILNGQLSIALLPNEEDRNVAEAFDYYNQNDFAAVIEIWPLDVRPPSDDVQRLILARCYAELARPECLELLSKVEPRFPTDAQAVRAIFHWRTGNTAEAAAALEAFFARLADDPWVIPVVSESAFSRAIDVAQADRGAAERLYRLLAKPFASWRFNYLRQLAAVRVAEQLGSQQVVEALEDLEPHVTWTAEVLEPRAKAYAAVGHPLAEQAARDWEWFQRHR
jgi:spermidine synthase